MRTLEDQLEDSNRVYHLNVARLQLECQTIKHEIGETNGAERLHYTETHLEELVYEIEDKFDKILEIDIGHARQDTAECIEQERENLRSRNMAILAGNHGEESHS